MFLRGETSSLAGEVRRLCGSVTSTLVLKKHIMQHGVDMARVDDCCPIFHRIWFTPRVIPTWLLHYSWQKTAFLSHSLEPCHATMITWSNICYWCSHTYAWVSQCMVPRSYAFLLPRNSHPSFMTVRAIHKCCCHKMTMYCRLFFLGEFKRLMRRHEGLFKSISHAQCRSSFNFSCSIQLASRF